MHVWRFKCCNLITKVVIAKLHNWEKLSCTEKVRKTAHRDCLAFFFSWKTINHNDVHIKTTNTHTHTHTKWVEAHTAYKYTLDVCGKWRGGAYSNELMHYLSNCCSLEEGLTQVERFVTQITVICCKWVAVITIRTLFGGLVIEAQLNHRDDWRARHLLIYSCCVAL